MLDKYKYDQPVVYGILNNAINNNKLSHAYLFDSNNNVDVYDIVMSFVKMIFTSNISSVEKKEILCNQIDHGNYLDVKIIEPDGLWIKKEQLMDLQNEFNKKSTGGNKKIYVIKSADKMNVQAANSILKFLEEPVDDIMAIMIVDNINLMLSTIISRCQVIKLNKNKLSTNTADNIGFLFSQGKYLDMTDDDKKKILDSVIEFILFFEANKIDTIIYSKKVWHNIFKDRELSLIAVNLSIYFYYDVIKYLSGLNNYFYVDRLDNIRKVALSNNYDSIINKINVLDEKEYELKRNLNINLLFDKMVIDMCGDR